MRPGWSTLSLSCTSGRLRWLPRSAVVWGIKVTLIYRRTKNLRAVQLLLGNSKLESTVRYLGIEVDDALEIAEQTET